eukprot:scaffold46940_cov32-Tisochrysis_lutea.AAC.4
MHAPESIEAHKQETKRGLNPLVELQRQHEDNKEKATTTMMVSWGHHKQADNARHAHEHAVDMP